MRSFKELFLAGMAAPPVESRDHCCQDREVEEPVVFIERSGRTLDAVWADRDAVHVDLVRPIGYILKPSPVSVGGRL